MSPSVRPQRIEPGPGQESVWDYPRPPVAVEADRHVTVSFGGQIIADSRHPIRVLETSHPPVYYVPPQDVRMEFLTPSGHHTVCEFKGIASYYHLTVDGRTSNNAAWYYSEPRPGYENLTGYVAFYPQSVDEATVDGERVGAQPGHFYGGWVTSEVVGPFKGEPGSNGW